MIPHLRSLYIPNIADNVHSAPDARDMALQILDIITLCPQVEICYMGILNKCFEVLENRNAEELAVLSTTPTAPPPPMVESEDGSEDEEDVEDSVL
jgi:hypothetical protein